MDKIKNTLFAVSLFYLIIYTPIVFMTYFPHWYLFNCKLHNYCDRLGYSNAVKYIDELTNFFLHRNDLSTDWTVKEKLHLAEVRDILDFLAIAAILGIILLIVFYNRTKISTFALVNLMIILSLLLLLPFFWTFWVKYFHHILFDNYLWKNNYLDRSYYIMPNIFFKHSFIFLVALSSLLNGLLWFSFRRYSKPIKKN